MCPSYRRLQGSDINLDGVVDYEEFLAATLNRTKLQREELLRQVGGGGAGGGVGGLEGESLCQ